MKRSDRARLACVGRRLIRQGFECGKVCPTCRFARLGVEGCLTSRRAERVLGPQVISVARRKARKSGSKTCIELGFARHRRPPSVDAQPVKCGLRLLGSETRVLRCMRTPPTAYGLEHRADARGERKDQDKKWRLRARTRTFFEVLHSCSGSFESHGLVIAASRETASNVNSSCPERGRRVMEWASDRLRRSQRRRAPRTLG
jgi:hypothetical protein